MVLVFIMTVEKEVLIFIVKSFNQKAVPIEVGIGKKNKKSQKL